jgi:hypothetical protein
MTAQDRLIALIGDLRGGLDQARRRMDRAGAKMRRATDEYTAAWCAVRDLERSLREAKDGLYFLQKQEREAAV